MSPLSLGDLPQIQSLTVGVRRLLVVQRVLVLVSNQRLVCCWQKKGAWRWTAGSLPDDSCRDGQPMQREAIGELLADLLLDAGVVSAEIELLLPLASAHWRVLDGVAPSSLATPDLLRGCLDDLDWPLDNLDQYSTFSVCSESVLAIGSTRSMLQAWIDVVEIADLPLRRVDWVLSSALKGLREDGADWSGDVIWLFPSGPSVRFILLRAGVPEVDRVIAAADPVLLRQGLRQSIAAWQSITSQVVPLGWQLSLPESLMDSVLPMIDPDRQEQLLEHPFPWLGMDALDGPGADALTAFEQLALRGLQEDIYA